MRSPSCSASMGAGCGRLNWRPSRSEAVGALGVCRRRHHDKPPKVDCEKDWWDDLQWDGLNKYHHPSSEPSHCCTTRRSCPEAPYSGNSPLP
ncbi:hypothetical protein ZWY2020_015422 [Hordeum vulgare]|nr:hypothetical protein ZWY2020_015422 [Hordeum vulgare]